jgi:methionyl aminopeptidase
MMSMKRPEDFARMRVAGKVVAEIHTRIREAAEPGVALIDLDRLAADIIRDRGCAPNFLNYGQPPFPGVTCLSINDEIVHGIPSGRTLKDGDLLSLDAGAIYEGWHADAAITFPIGDVEDDALRLIETTERAMWRGIEASHPGARLGDVGHAIGSVADEAGYGIVSSHAGHGIGRQMHEQPSVWNFGTPGKGMRLKAGMAICIEPMFNAGSHETRLLDDDWTVSTVDGSLSAHFEHTVAITRNGPEVLTLL